MTSDPAAFHRALLARPRGRQRHPAPAAALVALVAPAAGGVIIGLGTATAELARWAVLGTLGALGVLLLALAQLPEDTPRGVDGVRTPALLAERVLLLAASAAVAAELLTSAGLAAPRPLLAAVLVALALLARLTVAQPARRRVTAGLGVLAAVVLAVVVAAGAGAAAGGAVSGLPVTNELGRSPLTQLLAVGGAVALTGAVLQPALLVTRGRGLPRAGAAGTAVVLLLVFLGAGLVLGSDPLVLAVADAGLGGWAGPWVGVVLAGALLAAGASALSGVPRPPATWLVSRRWPAGAAGRRLSTGVAVAAAVLAAAAEPWGLVACYAAVVLLLAVVALLAGRREWRRRLDVLNRPGTRRTARRARALTGAGALVAGALLLLAVPRGWPALVAVAAGSAMMWGVSRHDRELRARLALDHAAEDRPLPTVVRAFVVVTELDRPAVRAVACARAMRATSVEALTVPGDEEAAAELRRQWAALDLPVPLVELAAPPGDAGAGVVAHVAAARRTEPDGLAVVYLPETTARRRWRRLLLGSGPQRLRARLLALPGTVVTTVPWPTEES
ncbi:hypothetical protein SAMN05216184_101511 [Georgenia satyanarayanai]|uniref:Amino acid transporter n=1 Tax=Georgenia satyanarayanai TaxID=860221 RepID=A0A2Y9A3S3_9MICO|nr:hypothetical protein [Georgenia satyanarayanai]PYG02046.1 hypothetical protein A8987_101511 [Georgenia satyanarayanai]SSA36857.1 hypothetical protein SAMN05216184_101511 [Georgenia satyanarayanai]